MVAQQEQVPVVRAQPHKMRLILNHIFLTKKGIVFVSLILFCCAFISAGQQQFDEMVNGQIRHTIPLLQTEELKQWIEKKQDFYLFDAREEKEYRISRIKQAQHVGYEHFRIFPLMKLDKSKPVVVYCSIGVRSEKIGEQLQQSGFTKVYNLFGGIFKWINSGYPVYNEKGETTEIHPYSKKWGKWLQKGKQCYE